MQTETVERREEQQLIRWRCEQLRAVGFGAAAATLLARDHRYDLHALIELVERGCPPMLAMRIIAPLEAESAA